MITKQLLSTRTASFLAPVLKYLNPSVWVAGGALVRAFEGYVQNESDYDLFGMKPEVIRDMLLADGWLLLFEHPRFWNFKAEEPGTIHAKVPLVQVIKQPYESIEQLLTSFDFKARMVGTDGMDLYADEQALKDIHDRKFHSNGTSFNTPGSLAALVKYANRGYTLEHKEAIKFLKAWGVPDSTLQASEMRY